MNKQGRAQREQRGKQRAEQREQLLIGFLASPQGKKWRGDEDAEAVVRVTLDFALGYSHGDPIELAAGHRDRDPLHWTPEVVEAFMTRWLARTVAREPAFFTRVPEVLPDWVRYAAGVRSLPAEALSESLRAIERWRQEMLDAVSDPEAWGAAKIFTLAAHTGGVDVADSDALNAFIERYGASRAA